MRVRAFIFVALFFIPSVPSFAQLIEIGGFANYNHFDIPPFPHDAVGVGGRLNIGLNHYVVLEGEGSYDFKHPAVRVTSSALGFNVDALRLGVFHANGGFKLQLKGGSYFLFLKGGMLRFMPDTRTTPVFGGIIGAPVTSGTDFSEGVFYPGAGVGFHAGILGIRVDAGDEIYWDEGTHHNLRITFGPTIRF